MIYHWIWIYYFNMKITPWIQHNSWNVGILSWHFWITTDGEILDKSKPETNGHLWYSWLAQSWELRKLIWRKWERVASLLFPQCIKQENWFDLIVCSGVDGRDIWIEVKTCKKWSTGVVRQQQMKRYAEHFGWHENVYLTQIYYGKSNISKFIPELIYVFPMSLVIYLINSISTTGHHPRMQFHALRMKWAEELFYIAKSNPNYTSWEFSTQNLVQNPNSTLRIIDTKLLPHILSLDPNFIG